jgi:SecD/SecF fusion protein
VKGFAFTLGVGTIVSLFTAVLFTQAVLGTMGRSRLLNSPAMLGAGKRHISWNFDFMGKSKIFFAMSGCILAVGSFALAGKGLNFGIDFKSGTRVTTSLAQPSTVEKVRSSLSPLGLSDAKIQQVKDPQLGPNVFQISTHKLEPEGVSKLQNRLDDKFGISKDGFSSTSVGPTFGKTVAKSALYAIIFSLLAIMAYVALRFSPKFSVPVLIALFHDVLITAGVYALTGREVTTSTVAALLTILGFSLYDTVIVFDRIRENAPRMPRAAFSQIVNRSMSEVLTRSLATSFSTLLPVAALLIFGGQTLKDFAFALLVGIASGTYSSIFIASPVLTAWKEREPVYVQRRHRILEDTGMVPAFAVATMGGVPAHTPRPDGVGHAAAPSSGGGGDDGFEQEEAADEVEQERARHEEQEEKKKKKAAVPVAEAGSADGSRTRARAEQVRKERAERKGSSSQRRRKHGRHR